MGTLKEIWIGFKSGLRELWKAYKPETYSHFEWQKPLAINPQEGTYINAIVAYRSRPNTVSEHVDDMIDGKPVVTSIAREVRINLWFVVVQFQWIRKCQHYVYDFGKQE